LSTSCTTQLLEQFSGNIPAKRINTTDETTSDANYDFVMIKALQDTTIDTTTGNINNFDGAVILAGDFVIGRWSSITLTSGDCIAYQGV